MNGNASASLNSPTIFYKGVKTAHTFILNCQSSAKLVERRNNSMGMNGEPLTYPKSNCVLLLTYGLTS
jgi:hypothetical protein